MGGADTVHANIRDNSDLPGGRSIREQQEDAVEEARPVNKSELARRIENYEDEARDLERRQRALNAAKEALMMAHEISSGAKVVNVSIPDVESKKVIVVEVCHPGARQSGRRYELTVPESDGVKAAVIAALVAVAEKRAENQRREAARAE